MLHTLLLILKIIGIILAILIGCILLIFCLIVFVPVRYRIEIKREESDGSPPIEVKAKVTWLLHFINIKFIYAHEMLLKARILFITVFRFPGKAGNGKMSVNVNGDDSGGLKNDNEENKNSSDREENEEKDEKSVSVENAQNIEEAESTEKTERTENTEEDENGENVEQNKKYKPTLKRRIERICDILKNIRYTIKRICGKIKEILENIEYYIEIIKGDVFRRSFSLCKDELADILGYIRPRKVEADFIIGTGDPASTGQVLSYYGMMYPIIGEHITVTGDFENKRIEGTALIAGKIKFFTFLKAVIRIYFSKDIRKLLKLFKKEDA